METNQFEILKAHFGSMESQLSQLTESQSEFQKQQVDTFKRIESLLKGLIGVHGVHDLPIGLKQINETLKKMTGDQ